MTEEGIERRRAATHDDLNQIRREFRDEMRIIHNELSEGLKQLQRAQADSDAKLSEKIDRQQKPLTEYAPVGVLLIALVGAVLAPLYAADNMKRAAIHDLEVKAVDDAYRAGQHEERFATLKLEVATALENRKAEFLAVRTEVSANRDRIEDLASTLDNGLGRRIHEVIEPDRRDIQWLMRGQRHEP